nr:hydantoinase B/oxoprolinase family protein [Burkholderia ambifaria]
MPPDSTHIDEEGVLIDNWQLVSAGVLRDADTRALLASGRYPARNVEQNMADLRAQVAANQKGVDELRGMVAQFGATSCSHSWGTCRTTRKKRCGV